MNENEQLSQILEAAPESREVRPSNLAGDPSSRAPVVTSTEEFRQWQVGSNGMFRPCGFTEGSLPPGVYGFTKDEYGRVIANQVNIVADELAILPDTANDRVLSGIDKFWRQGRKYRKHGLIYKRGILLWGPPGSGKTATILLLTAKLVGAGGMVVICDNPSHCSDGLQVLRRIEPDRRLICIIEDIDETITKYGEHSLLALLDGENQIDNVVMIATTNYPDRLGARIINRPSRFDECILVGMPSSAARRAYLGKVALGLDEQTLTRWVDDTEDFSVAHLRELAAAVLCLDQPYEQVLSRLKSMRSRPREKSGFNDKPVGF